MKVQNEKIKSYSSSELSEETLAWEGQRTGGALCATGYNQSRLVELAND
jgi:hypothetical protein